MEMKRTNRYFQRVNSFPHSTHCALILNHRDYNVERHCPPKRANINASQTNAYGKSIRNNRTKQIASLGSRVNAGRARDRKPETAAITAGLTLNGWIGCEQVLYQRGSHCWGIIGAIRKMALGIRPTKRQMREKEMSVLQGNQRNPDATVAAQRRMNGQGEDACKRLPLAARGLRLWFPFRSCLPNATTVATLVETLGNARQ